MKRYWKIELLLLLAVLSVVILLQHPLKTNVEKGISAMVYQDGKAVEETVIQIDGSVLRGPFAREASFSGHFVIPQWEPSSWPKTFAKIVWDVWEQEAETLEEQHIIFYQIDGGIPDTPVEGRLLIDLEMKEFALGLTDGRIIATSEQTYEQYQNLAN